MKTVKIVDLCDYQSDRYVKIIEDVECAGVIFRFTKKNGKLDTIIPSAIKLCERLGKPYGFYKYTYAKDYDSAYDEVFKILTLLPEYSGEMYQLGFWLDLERSDMRGNVVMARNVFETYQKFMPTVCIYCDLDFYNTTIKSWYHGKLWIAKWGHKAPDINWNVWQFTDNWKSYACDCSEYKISDNDILEPKLSCNYTKDGIECLQKYLNTKDNAGLTVDGIFGSKTFKATINHINKGV